MITHKIRYDIIEGKLITGSNPLQPVIRTYSDSMASGNINFNVFEASIYDSITAKIYKLQKPNTGDDRWIRQGSDLYTSSNLYYKGILINSEEYAIEFKFLPAQISGVSDGDYYSIEFFVTVISAGAIKHYSPKLIINVRDRIYG